MFYAVLRIFLTNIGWFDCMYIRRNDILWTHFKTTDLKRLCIWYYAYLMNIIFWITPALHKQLIRVTANYAWKITRQARGQFVVYPVLFHTFPLMLITICFYATVTSDILFKIWRWNRWGLVRRISPHICHATNLYT